MTRSTPWRTRWWTPAVALVLGALILAASAVGGDTGDGLKAFGVMAAVAGLSWSGRSDTLTGLGGRGRDERWSAIDLRASAFAGLVVAVVLGGSWLWELAQGEDGEPYVQLLAVGGVAYVLAIAVLHRRG